MLVENGQVKKVICAFTAATRPTDVLPFTKYYESGEVDAELVPQGTLAERLRAAGAGIPAFYTPTAVGTELAEGRETRVINGREYLLEYALPLDYAFIRARTRGYGRQPAVPSLAAELQPGDGDRCARAPSPRSRSRSCRPAASTPTTCIPPASTCTDWCRCRRNPRACGRPAGRSEADERDQGPHPPADGGPRGARVPGRLDRQPGRRHSDDVLQHRYRRPRHHLSFRERRDRLWPRGGGRGRKT